MLSVERARIDEKTPLDDTHHAAMAMSIQANPPRAFREQAPKREVVGKKSPLVPRENCGHIVLAEAMAQEKRSSDRVEATRHGQGLEIRARLGRNRGRRVRVGQVSHLVREKPA